MIDFDQYDKQLEDLQNKLKALHNPVNNSDWQNAKFKVLNKVPFQMYARIISKN